MDGLQDVIWQALGAVLVAIAGVIAREIKRWADTRQKGYLIKWAVEGAEQVYKNEDGKRRNEEAKRMAVNLLNKNGLNVSEEELSDLIEAMVFEMNKELKNTPPIELELNQSNEDSGLELGENNDD